MRNVVFVAPFPMETTLRFATAVAGLHAVRLLGVWQKPPPPGLFADSEIIDDATHAGSIAAGVQRLSRRHGPIHRIVGVLENIQVQLAEVREHLGVEGPTVDVTRRFRDKAHMKDTLRSAGIPCAQHRMLHSEEDGWQFARAIGFPQVLKPPEGAGCLATYRVANESDLAGALRASRPAPDRPVLAEEFLQGKEHSFEAITIGGEPVFHSITHYFPTPLEAMENPWIKWCIVAPRHIQTPEYDEIRTLGVRAIRAFGLRDGMTHMEWFRRPNGSLAIGEIAARPPGAEIVRLISECYQTDGHRAWARAVVDSEWDGPWDRSHAAGVAFLRGPGSGRVTRITGVEQAQEAIGDLVVEARLPQAGKPKSSSYEGDGWVVIRHPETRVVIDALTRLIRTVEVHYE